MQRRMMQEESRAATTASSMVGCIIQPLPNDCLFGRGRPYQRHPGNVRMLQFVERNKAHYQRKETTRDEKKHIVLRIMQEIQVTYGGRFLKQQLQNPPPPLRSPPLQQLYFDTDPNNKNNNITTNGTTTIIEASQWYVQQTIPIFYIGSPWFQFSILL